MSERPPIAVVGAGLMGHAIAQVFVDYGHAVVVHDPNPAVLEGIGELSLPTVRAEPDLSRAVTAAAWVFEAAPEDLELKQALFEAMDGVAPTRTVLATNTSVLRVSEVAARVRHPARVVGTHWWNPAHLVPLVEVVQGERTGAGVIERTIDLLWSVGKTPVHVRRDVAGFVGNRLQHAMWREAFALVDDGVCDAHTIDTVVKAGFGRRLGVLGPMENADLVGLDMTLAIHEYLLPRLTPPSQPASGLRDRVAAGHLGMKAGQGYQAWSADDAARARRQLDAALTDGMAG